MDEHANESLRTRVRRQVLELVNRMDLEHGTRLLSENQLAAKFQVSRSTIRAVLTELDTEGKVIRRHGSGTYVNPQALNVETTLYPSVNMYDLIRKNGYKPSIRILNTKKALAGERGKMLNLLSFEPVIENYSVYCADGVTCMYCVDCMDAGLISKENWENLKTADTSIYESIRRLAGISIEWDIIRVRSSDNVKIPELNECFSIPDGKIKSVVHLEISNFTRENHPVLLGNIYIDTEKIELNIVRDLGGRKR